MSDGLAAVAERPPRGMSRSALVTTARRLFAEHGPGAVSVRSVAREASVNYGLIHRYFGSKEGLLAAVLEQLNDELAADLADGPPDRGVLELLENHKDLWRIRAYLCLENDDLGELVGGQRPLLESVRRQLRQRDLDEERVAIRSALATALLLGWVTMEPFLREAAGLDRFAPSSIASEVDAALERLVEWPAGS